MFAEYSAEHRAAVAVGADTGPGQCRRSQGLVNVLGGVGPMCLMQNKVLCDHSAAFREESELLHHQIDEMSGMMNKLIAENARYPIQLKPILRWCYRLVDQAGAGAREDVGWQKVSVVEDCADIQSLRACNLKLEAEMTQIKVNSH